MQSSPPVLYPATDSEYRIQWGTYDELVNAQLQQLKSSAVELEKMISAQGDRLATLNQQIRRVYKDQIKIYTNLGIQLLMQ